MNEREAIAQGLHYTGMSFDRWDSKRAERYAQEAKEFKAKYKVRLVKVRDHNGWYSYYGDDNFITVQYDTVEILQKRLDNVSNRLAKAKEDYERAVAEIEKDKQETIDKMEKVKEIMK